MRYGENFWCVGKDGTRLEKRVYPKTVGFEYAAVDPTDRTGDRGEFLLEPFAIDYVPPGETDALRMCIFGDPDPKLHENSFDWDWASIPRMFRSIVCDKADHRIRVASLFHDMGYCVQDIWPGLDRAFWDRLIFEVMEAYSAAPGEPGYCSDRVLRNEVLAGVMVGGGFAWKKPQTDVEMYRKMFLLSTVPV